jgi:hypothetical protein
MFASGPGSPALKGKGGGKVVTTDKSGKKGRGAHPELFFL